MSNLIKDLGVPYCNENLIGSLLFVEGVPHIINEITQRGISTTSFKGQISKPVLANVNLPVTILDKGFESLKYPRLGYRSAAKGKVLMELELIPNFKRGLRPDSLQVTFPAPITFLADKLAIDLNHYTRDNVKPLIVASEDYMSMQDGLAAIRKGDIYTFAVSHELAVIPAAIEGGYLEIVYRGRTVGEIAASGKVSGTITKVNKLMEHLNGNGLK